MEQEFIEVDKYLQLPGEISPHQKELIKFQKIRSYFDAEINEKILVIVL